MSRRYEVRYVQVDGRERHFHIIDTKNGETRNAQRLPEGWAIALADSWNAEEEIAALRSSLSAKEAENEALRKERDTLKSLEQQAWHKAQFELERAVKAEAKSAKDVEWAKGMRHSYEEEISGLKCLLRVEREQVKAAESRLRRMEEALEVYVRRYEANGKCWNWMRGHDSYGETVLFDWKGDEQDDPWEIAERALAHAPDANRYDKLLRVVEAAKRWAACLGPVETTLPRPLEEIAAEYRQRVAELQAALSDLGQEKDREEWCGCTGAEWAHTLGAPGFKCAAKQGETK